MHACNSRFNSSPTVSSSTVTYVMTAHPDDNRYQLENIVTIDKLKDLIGAQYYFDDLSFAANIVNVIRKGYFSVNQNFTFHELTFSLEDGETLEIPGNITLQNCFVNSGSISFYHGTLTATQARTKAIACGDDAIANAAAKGAEAHSLAAEAIANAKAKGSSAYAKVKNAIANACVVQSTASADAENAVANATTRGTEAYATVHGAIANAMVDGTEAYAVAHNAIANANANGAQANSRGNGAIANATVAGAMSISLSLGAVANATQAQARAIAEVRGAIAKAIIAGALAIGRKPGAIVITAEMYIAQEQVNARLNSLIYKWKSKDNDIIAFKDYFITTQKMWGTKEAINYPAVFAEKQLKLLDQMDADPDLRETCFTLAAAGNADCHDNAYAMFLKMQEKALEINMLQPGIPKEVLINYGLALENQALLEQLIERTPELKRGIGGGEGIEAQLALQLLCHKKNILLPIPVTTMSYEEAGWEQFRGPDDNKADIIHIKSFISDLLDNDGTFQLSEPSPKFLATQPFWQAYIDRMNPTIIQYVETINEIACTQFESENIKLFSTTNRLSKDIEIERKFNSIEQKRQDSIANLYLKETIQLLK